MPFPTSVICEISFYISGYCEELDAFPSLNFIQHSHTTLEDLELKGWAKLNSLPGKIQHFTTLETLIIDSFDGIETLPEWLGNLSSLKTLRIWDFNNLMYLPTTRLIKLEELHISNCSKLKERCAKGSQEEWLKIAHIPNITIDDTEINKEDAEFSASPITETQHCPYSNYTEIVRLFRGYYANGERTEMH